MRNLLAVIGIVISVQPIAGCGPGMVAGAGMATALVANDRRSMDVVMQDQLIETKANDAIYGHELLGRTVHVNVTSYNRHVLLTGEVPEAAMRDQIEALVTARTDLKTLHNEIIVGPNSPLESRSRDGMITANVKTSILRRTKVDPTKIKVVTEQGNVYLMGIVTSQEADQVVELVRNTKGVAQVTKIFEYIEEVKIAEPAQEVDPGIDSGQAHTEILEKLENIQPYVEEPASAEVLPLPQDGADNPPLPK